MFGNGYTGGYGTPSSSGFGFSTGSTVWTLVSLILAIIGCFVVYFLFVNKKTTPKNKFAAWLKEFLDFKKMLIEAMLKISYLFGAIFITLASFALIGTSFLGFLLTLVLGNLILRLCYEGFLVLIMIWKNSTEINKKMK